jgi:hypothetical protein
LLGIRLDYSGWETKRLYDTDAIAEMTGGPEAREQMMDATKGLGPGRRGKDGRHYHQDSKSGDWSPLTSKQIDTYLDGPVVDEIPA